MKNVVEQFFEEQLQKWEMAKSNYDAMHEVETKSFMINGYRYNVQFNPKRIVSSNAKVDNASIKERPCFLCPKNQPKAQISLLYNNDFKILVNPFPIFRRHLTIPLLEHKPQQITKYFTTLLDLTKYNKEYFYFYNGPKCGASAPDHMHFQAGNKGVLPIEKEWEKYPKETIGNYNNALLITLNEDVRHPLIIESTNKEDAQALFNLIFKALQDLSKELEEPMLNIIAWENNDKYIISLFPRKAHRPSCYYKENKEEQLLISPASVDMGGLFILPQKKDFYSITSQDIKEVLEEVCLSENEHRKIISEIVKQL